MADMLPEEKAFLRLMAELASDGLFNGRDRDGVWERIVEAFEAAVEAAKTQKNPPALAGPAGSDQLGIGG